jgi:hypothetical protein
VLQGIWETLAISIVGTLLAAIAGLLLALPRWRAPWNVVLNVLRSVPELVWATITALAGPGPVCRCAGLALHTTGVLGRLFAEALQNAPAAPANALKLSGSNRLLAFCYGTLPWRSAAVAGIHAVPLGNEYPHGGDSGLCGSRRAGPAAVLRAFAVPLCPGQHRDHGHALAEHCRGLEQRGLRRAMR